MGKKAGLKKNFSLTLLFSSSFPGHPLNHASLPRDRHRLSLLLRSTPLLQIRFCLLNTINTSGIFSPEVYFEHYNNLANQLTAKLPALAGSEGASFLDLIYREVGKHKFEVTRSVISRRDRDDSVEI